MHDVDPFDLPEWLGDDDVTWSAESGLRTGHRVRGSLTGSEPGRDIACDLLAIDDAYPEPVAVDDVRLRAHRAWRYHQILVVSSEDRLTLAAPGTGFTADLVLDVLERLAKAVGASPERYAAHLRIGARTR